jgi:hypothetical protein
MIAVAIVALVSDRRASTRQRRGAAAASIQAAE